MNPANHWQFAFFACFPLQTDVGEAAKLEFGQAMVGVADEDDRGVDFRFGPTFVPAANITKFDLSRAFSQCFQHRRAGIAAIGFLVPPPGRVRQQMSGGRSVENRPYVDFFRGDSCCEVTVGDPLDPSQAFVDILLHVAGSHLDDDTNPFLLLDSDDGPFIRRGVRGGEQRTKKQAKCKAGLAPMICRWSFTIVHAYLWLFLF